MLKTQFHKMDSWIQEQLEKESFADSSHGFQDLSLDPRKNYVKHFKADLSQEDFERLCSEYFDSGPLKKLIDDEGVTEISINAYNNIWYEKAGSLHSLDDHFFSLKNYHFFLKELSRSCNFEVSLKKPFINLSWRDFRVHIVYESLSLESHVMSLRRVQTNFWTIKHLEEKNFCTKEESQILQKIVLEKANILVVGATGAGKTSLLSALLKEISATTRVIVLEDTNEVALPNLASVKLLTREGEDKLYNDVSLHDLVKQSLRMRPDRIVLGEVRGSEAKDLLLALATGHNGSMGTLHATSGHEALLRLEMLIQLGAPEWSLEAIRRLIFLSLNYVVSVEKDEQGKRRLKSIEKLCSLESMGITLETI